ncbi:MAG: 3-hydroxyacyl-ACP dehydratase FabZ [Armatimonadaceae bacterium]
MDIDLTKPLDIRIVQRILPHRYPFLLIDRILEVEAGVRIKGIKNVTVNEPFFNGHFPGNPIMPGVLQLEMMAQISGISLLLCPEYEGRLALLAAIDKARFRRPVVPGDVLLVEAEVTKMRGPKGWVKCTATVEGKVVCEAEIVFALSTQDRELGV